MGAAMDTLMREMGELDENADPRRVGAFFRRFSDLAGLEMGPRMEDALSRLEAGQEIDELESELEDLDQDDSLEDLFRLKKAVERRRRAAAGRSGALLPLSLQGTRSARRTLENRFRLACGEERRDAFERGRHRGAGRLHAATGVHQRRVVAVRRHLRRVDPHPHRHRAAPGRRRARDHRDARHRSRARCASVAPGSTPATSTRSWSPPTPRRSSSPTPPASCSTPSARARCPPTPWAAAAAPASSRRSTSRPRGCATAASASWSSASRC